MSLIDNRAFSFYAYNCTRREVKKGGNSYIALKREITFKIMERGFYS